MSCTLCSLVKTVNIHSHPWFKLQSEDIFSEDRCFLNSELASVLLESMLLLENRVSHILSFTLANRGQGHSNQLREKHSCVTRKWDQIKWKYQLRKYWIQWHNGLYVQLLQHLVSVATATTPVQCSVWKLWRKLRTKINLEEVSHNRTQQCWSDPPLC